MPSFNWVQNAFLSFVSNLLPAAQVNAFLHAARIGGMTGGEINLGGSGNAAPTGTGLVDKAALIAAGVSVITN
jgi:hypothetical protein